MLIVTIHGYAVFGNVYTIIQSRIYMKERISIHTFFMTIIHTTVERIKIWILHFINFLHMCTETCQKWVRGFLPKVETWRIVFPVYNMYRLLKYKTSWQHSFRSIKQHYKVQLGLDKENNVLREIHLYAVNVHTSSYTVHDCDTQVVWDDLHRFESVGQAASLPVTVTHLLFTHTKHTMTVSTVSLQPLSCPPRVRCWHSHIH